MLVSQEIWLALFSCYIILEIPPLALLSTNSQMFFPYSETSE